MFIRKPHVISIVLFCLITICLYSLFHFLLLNGWVVDNSEYKLVIETRGNVKDLVVIEYVYYFNASTAITTKPEGVEVETSYTPYDSRIKITFNGFAESKQVTVVLHDMSITGNISVDEDRRFSQVKPLLEGNLDNYTHIFSHFSVSVNTPYIGKINVYSDSIDGTVKDGEVQWSSWPQSKTKTLTVAKWASLFLSATISSLAVHISSHVLKKKTFLRFPIVTLAMLSTMCFVYLLAGVGNDFISLNNASELSRYTLSFLSMFFHGNYGHLMENILVGFVISGSLIEIWFLQARKLDLYLWYFSPLPISVLLGILPILRSQGSITVSVGASFWIIGMTVALIISVIRNRTVIQQSASKWEFIALLLLGYLTVSIVWNYIAGILIYHYSEKSVSTSAGHLFFLIVSCMWALAWIGLRRSVRRHL